MNPADGPMSEMQKKLTSVGRYGKPEEIAAAVAFLAHPTSSFINGENLTVDGRERVAIRAPATWMSQLLPNEMKLARARHACKAMLLLLLGVVVATTGALPSIAADAASPRSNEQTVREFFTALEAMDIERFLKVWDERGVQIMPFAPESFPSRLDGRDAVKRQYESLPKNFTSMRFPGLTIYPTQDAGVLWAT